MRNKDFQPILQFAENYGRIEPEIRLDSSCQVTLLFRHRFLNPFRKSSQEHPLEAQKYSYYRMSVATEPAATFVFVLMTQRKQVEDAFSVLQRHFRFVFLVYECLLLGLDVLISKGLRLHHLLFLHATKRQPHLCLQDV